MLIQEPPQPSSNRFGTMTTLDRIRRRRSLIMAEYRSMGHLLMCSFVWWTAVSLIASILLVAGFWLPYWIHGIDPNANIQVSFGPFQRCNFPMRNDQGQIQIVFKCARYARFDDIPTFTWKVTTVLVGVGCLLSMLMALILLFSCCMPQALTSSNTAIIVFFQMLIVVMVTAGCTSYFLGWNHPEVRLICGDNSLFQLEKCNLSLSVHLMAISLFLLIVCLIFGWITTRKFNRYRAF